METSDSLAPVILIVDDNTENIQVLGKLLKEKYYKVEFALDGEAALKWLMKKQFDLVLLDINMPGMSGFEVCKKIRSNPEMNKLPVIFLSAENDRESILKGFEMGGQDYVTKPFDSRELIVRVKTHIALKFSLEKLEALNQYLEDKVKERTHQLKEANEQLEATNLKLVDFDKAKNLFLNLISHEIRTPLNGIMGPLQLLKGPLLTNEIATMVQILDVSVSRLEKFAMNALLITGLKTNNKISKYFIQLEKLISEVISEFEDKLKSKNLHIKMNMQEDQISISGERGLIKTCFFNIIDNAIRYSPKDGLIDFRCFAEDKYIICEVQDNGDGFSKSVIDQQFDLFITDHKYSDNQIGLDLPIVKMIMEAHEGKAILFNDPLGGAVVRLEFIKAIEK